MITKNILEKAEPFSIIATWILENSEDQVFLERKRDGVKDFTRWVAVRWQIHDWCIYYAPVYDEAYSYQNWSDEEIKREGDKLSKYFVNKVVVCDKEALDLYRG